MNMKKLCVGAALCGVSAFAGAEPIIFYAPHGGGIVVRDSNEKTLPPGLPTEVLSTGGITFNLYYQDVISNTNAGFDSPSVGANARARVNDTLTYMADVLNEAGTLDILFNLSLDNSGSGTLASAGTYYPAADGFFTGSTMDRLHDPGDAKPFANVEEIAVTMNFGKNWNFSAAPATSGQFDLVSVLLHEFTHGLGFASLSSSTGASQFFAGNGVKTFTQYDTLLRRRTGNVTLFSGAPPALQGAASSLTSGDLAFGGTEAAQAYLPNAAPGIYAPGVFSGGSSLSHWDTGNIVGGAVMEHAISSGENQRTYSPIDVAALRDIGYLDAEDGPVVDCDLASCPPFATQGTGFYLTLAGLLALPLDFATTDADGLGIPDRFEVALIERVLCSNASAFGNTVICDFNANRIALESEVVYPLISAYSDVAAALLTVSSELQSAFPGLSGSYVAFTDGAKAVGEPLSPQGDPDADGFSNLEEYQNVAADGGDENDFATAALNPLLDGSQASAQGLPLAGILGLGGLLVAVGALGAARARKK